jgi:AraC-like DNA-binding protein
MSYPPAVAQRVVTVSVRRVLRAMRADPARAFSLDDLAVIAGISARSLQRQFRASLGQTPIEALRTIRLERARRGLLLAARGQTISDIALCCGSSHLGRFSIEYRRLYGETPSQTLRRQESFNGTEEHASRVFAVGADRPAIAVPQMPLDGVDRETVRNLREELVTALLRSGVTVTERPDRARYHLHCVCRRSCGETRVTFRLLDAATGRHIWAFDQDAVAGSDFDSDERLALHVSAALLPSLRAAEIDRVRCKSDADLTTYDFIMRAWPLVTALDAEGHKRAIELLQRARSRDPANGLAIALEAWCHSQRAVYQFTDNTSSARMEALELASLAARCGGDGTTFAILGHALACAHDLQAAAVMTRKALALDGGSAWAWGRSAWLDVYAGRAATAIERFKISLQLAPHDPLAFNNYAGLGCAYLGLNNYGEAACWLERAVLEHPPAAWAHRVLGPVHLLAGNRAQAQRSLAVVKRLYPDATATQCASAAPLHPADRDRIANGLESMGLRS